MTIAFCFILSCVAAISQGAISLPSTWSPPASGYDAVYDADYNQLPTASTPAFTSTYTNTPPSHASAQMTNDSVTGENVLCLVNSATLGPIYTLSSGVGQGANTGSMTIDLRLRLTADTGTTNNFQFSILVNRPASVAQQAAGTNSVQYYFRFGDNAASYLKLGNDWHDMRILIDADTQTASLYLDGSSTKETLSGSTLSITTSSSYLNQIRFGDGGSTTGIGAVNLAYFAWSNTEEANLTKIRTVPDFGVTLNDDGNSFFSPWAYTINRTNYSRYSLTNSVATMLYEAENLLLPGREPHTIFGKIDTLMVGVALGSENTWWDTQVIGGSRIGWMFTDIVPGTTNTYSSTAMVDYPRVILSITGTNRANAALHPSYTNGPMDLYYYIATLARANGIRFFPSVRMNDMHFASEPWKTNEFNRSYLYEGEDPEELPETGNWHYGTGKFWVNHNGSGETKDYRLSPSNQRFDYGQAEFRSYRLTMIHEILERCASKISGIELDFSRSATLFTTYNGTANKAYVTGMLKEIRAHLDDLERRTLRQYYLVVRVATTMANSQYSNMDVATWLSNTNTVPQLHWAGTTSFATNCPYPASTNQESWTERLVDVVIPGSTYDMAYDMPIYPEASATDDYITIAHNNGAKVYAAVFERSQWNWPFNTAPSTGCYTVALANWRPTPELIAGAVANYINMGCDGFQMFNYRLPLAAKMTVEPAGEYPLSETVRDLLYALKAEPLVLEDISRVYAITPNASATSDVYSPPFTSWPETNANVAGYVYEKQLPRIMTNAVWENFKFYIGENFSDTKPGSVYLRLGLASVDVAMKPDYNADFTATGGLAIRVGYTGETNNYTVYNGGIAVKTVSTTRDALGNPAASTSFPSVPRAYFQCQVPPETWGNFTNGENSVRFIVNNTVSNFAIVSVELGVFPADE